MRKFLFSFVSGVLLSCLVLTNLGYAAESPSIVINGQQIQVTGQGTLIDGSTVYVPAKELLKHLEVNGYTDNINFEWDSKTQTLKCYAKVPNVLFLSIPANKNEIYEGNNIYKLDTPTKIVNGTLMVPISLIPKMFRYTTKYDSASNKITLDYNPNHVFDVNNNNQSEVSNTKSPINTESAKVTEFKKKIKDYLGRNLWVVGGETSVYFEGKTGNEGYLQNLSPVWITKIEEDIILKDVFTITFKSGNKEYIMPYANEELLSIVLVKENPLNKYKWSKKVWDSIKNEEIFIGMNREMVTLSWGVGKINKTTYNWGTLEQWVYRNDYFVKYVYFKNGIVTSIQTME